MDNISDRTLILIDKYHSGQASSEEISLLVSWKNASSANLANYNDFIGFLELIQSVNQWKQFDKQQAWSKFQHKLQSKVRKLGWVMYAAAAMLLLVLAATVWNFGTSSDYSSPSFIAGNQDRFAILSDGSELFLEDNSKIYTENFRNKSRVIRSEGDYFVNVEHNKKYPFVIETNRLSIKVLGTSFKVEEDENATIVKVRDGKVLITSTDGSTYNLRRNEMIKISKDGVVVGKVQETDWGLFTKSYEDKSIINVINDLSDQFGKLKINSKTINSDCRITTKIEQSTIIEILNEIDLIFNVDYTIKEGTIVVNNISC
jgi:ferric-dicitrate binding protein FerR (iron transport regulator)